MALRGEMDSSADPNARLSKGHATRFRPTKSVMIHSPTGHSAWTTSSASVMRLRPTTYR